MITVIMGNPTLLATSSINNRIADNLDRVSIDAHRTKDSTACCANEELGKLPIAIRKRAE